MVGIFDKLTRYGEREIVDFYTHVGKRQLTYIAKFYGYPTLDLQQEITKKYLELSCQNMRQYLTDIGKIYHELRPLYNAYKHGYRVLLAKDNASDNTFPFIDYNGKQKFTQVNKDAFNRILSLSHSCRDILEHIYVQHRTRNAYERAGGKEGKLQVNLFLKGTDSHPVDGDLQLSYPTRGNRTTKEKGEGDRMYNMFKDELEKYDRGKIVAIDIDTKEIIAKDYGKEKVLYQVRDTNHSGRIHIRRVSEDGSTGIEIY